MSLFNRPGKKVTKRYKGGGSTTASTIPDWAVPYLKNVGNQAESLYGSGQLDNVAGVNPLLQAAYGSGAQAIAGTTQAGLAQNAAQQTRLKDAATSGGYDTDALKDAAVMEADMKTANQGKQYGASGTLGSARQAVEQGATNAATRAQFASIDQNAAQTNFQNKMAAEQALASSGAQGQALATGAAQSFSSLGDSARNVEQQFADAPWQALQRYSSTIYGNPAKQQTTASGGK